MASPPRNTSSSPKPSSKPRSTASPSASILLISSANEILLLRRVKQSTSFASAHVFPGGHIDAQDGPLPPLHGDVRLHEDSAAYRVGAIRECFEESGILLARRRRGESKEEEEEPSSSTLLLQLDEQERDAGRRAIHGKEVGFQEWVRTHGGVLDTEALHPFTRWLTPAHIARRFSTQMYIYFLPLEVRGGIPQMLHVPTSDGGVEHTEAEFLPAREWLARAQADKIILFPPQFFLLSLVADFLGTTPGSEEDAEGLLSTQRLQAQREALLDFVKSGDPPWGEKCISPSPLRKDGKELIMGLNEPGPELEGTDRKGDDERVIWVRFKGKDGTSGLNVGWRTDVMPQGPDTAESNKSSETETGERQDTRQDVERALRGRQENL
ncbi:MAG: hypothetical protein LQ341_002789 [Variospora aurantia]|nr:MAG: hypothetical protein LQ341_002789 [Variospora aurantia]